jgi:hypothetical protein
VVAADVAVARLHALPVGGFPFEDLKVRAVSAAVAAEPAHDRTRAHVQLFPHPVVVAYAESFGAKGYRVTSAGELLPTLKKALTDDTVSIIACPVDYTANAELISSLGDLGLADGLASLARSIAQVRVRVTGTECPLPEHVVIALYRIAQEALQNVVKHAQATQAEVELRCDASSVLLRVTDNRQGFDVGARSDSETFYGLRSMTERAELVGGRLTVTSRPGLGTTVTATVPMRSA